MVEMKIFYQFYKIYLKCQIFQSYFRYVTRLRYRNAASFEFAITSFCMSENYWWENEYKFKFLEYVTDVTVSPPLFSEHFRNILETFLEIIKNYYFNSWVISYYYYRNISWNVFSISNDWPYHFSEFFRIYLFIYLFKNQFTLHIFSYYSKHRKVKYRCIDTYILYIAEMHEASVRNPVYIKLKIYKT